MNMSNKVCFVVRGRLVAWVCLFGQLTDDLTNT